MMVLIWIFALLTAATSWALVWFAARVATSSSPAGTATSTPARTDMGPFLLWGSFYVNPDDPRGWVPKTNGLGWTVNFRTRENAYIFAALIAVCGASALGLTISVWMLA